ncbi:MAG TPA: hypothetical protein VHN13_04120, partial [Candidatus Tectomicrobia bacterium]|nr:hypothetical protein [Candidatus Tectomicrobia bacterium]
MFGGTAGRVYNFPPNIFGAAVTAETARWVGGWADGLLTVGGAPEAVRQRLDAFGEGGGAGKNVAGWSIIPAMACRIGEALRGEFIHHG